MARFEGVLAVLSDAVAYAAISSASVLANAVERVLTNRSEREFLRQELESARSQVRYWKNEFVGCRKAVLRDVIVVLQQEMARRPDVSEDNKSIANAACLRLMERLGRLDIASPGVFLWPLIGPDWEPCLPKKESK